MQPNKTKIALVIGALYLGVSGASDAVAKTFTMTVNTIDDVTIESVTDLDFGELITTSANTDCTMEGRYPAWADINIVNSVAPTAGQSILTGTACVNSTVSTGTVGLYKVVGTPGLSVNLTISEIAQEDPLDPLATAPFTFEPQGCYTNYSGDNTADADSCTVYTAGTTYPSVILPVDDATETEGATGIVTGGEIFFTVGGMIDIGPAGLSSSTDYKAKFQVDVTY